MVIDYIIIALYLIVIMYIGVATAGKLKNINDFSVSTKKYGVFALTATLSASFIGGGFSTGNASKVATMGVGNIVALCGFSVSLIILGRFIVPRIYRFTSAISTGEIMKIAYGKPAQIFTGIFGMLVCAGILGAQVGAIGYILNIFLGIPTLGGIILGCGVVLIYSTCGGLQAVIATDVIQFVVLGVGMPILFIIGIHACGGVENIIQSTQPEMFDILNGKTLPGFISLFLTLAIGEILVPPYVQRLLVGSNLKTTAKATVVSGIISIPFFIITGLVGLIGAVYFAGTGVDTNSIMQSLIKEVAPVGIRGVLIAGMLSIVMSSADSFLNSAAVGLVNDVVIPIRGARGEKSDLMLLRLVNLITGVVAIIFAVTIPNILDILTFSYSFWCPMILVPLGAALCGVRTKPVAFYIGLSFGVVAMGIWSYVLKNPFDIDGTIVGTVLNAVAFFITVAVVRDKEVVKA